MTAPACHTWRTPERPDGDPRAALLAWHAGRCAFCGKPPSGSTHDGLMEDHDHRTGWVRGYLCKGCNLREVVAVDQRPWELYRKCPPAVMMGVQYIHPEHRRTTTRAVQWVRLDLDDYDAVAAHAAATDQTIPGAIAEAVRLVYRHTGTPV